jgi:ribosomal protein S27AE
MINAKERFSCGCCGVTLIHTDRIWCGPCSKHVRNALFVMNATYFAQHNTICPYDVEGQKWSRQMAIDDSNRGK